MGTTLRPELSEKNKYWIDRHRYYELKHFCLQYPIWKTLYATYDGLSKKPSQMLALCKATAFGDPTAECAEARVFYAERIRMIEQAALEADSVLSGYILKAVTEGISYDHLNARLNVPCGKDYYYETYRRFFWLLSAARK